MPYLQSSTGVVASDLRPLTIGELIDRTFQLYRRHFIQLFLFSALIYSLWFVLGVIATFLGWQESAQQISKHLVLLMLIAPAYLVVLILMKLGEGALVYYASELYLGRAPLLKDGFRSLRNRVWPILWTTFLKTVVTTLAFLLVAVPLIVLFVRKGHLTWQLVMSMLAACVVLLIPGLILAVRYLLSDQVVMLENGSGWSAVQRSSELIRYDPGLGIMYWGETRISILLLVIAVASILIGAVSSVPALLSRIPGLLHGNYTALDMNIPTGVRVITHLLNFLGTSLVAPLFAIVKTAFYYDVRIRKEGFDLEILTAALETDKREN
jgi:hypothetical protein